jgi:hypothetical protein
VWRNELFDVFYEELGVPWFGGPLLGTPVFNAWPARSAPSGVGPHRVVLPGSSVGAGTSTGPGSLVMRGESVPPATRWAGNPIRAI